MNLLDRTIDNQLLDLNITSQLSDISYRTNNSIKQKNRNFTEGIIDSGRIHFNDAKDKITKDMILEYQEEQQQIKPLYTDPVTGDQKIYYPSIYKLDPTLLSVPAPVNYTTTGAPATQDDLNNFEASNLVPEINNYSKIEQDIIKNQEILKDLKHNENVYNGELRRLNNLLTEHGKRDRKLKRDIKANIDTIKIYDTSLLSLPTGKKLTTRQETEKQSWETTRQELIDQNAELQAELLDIDKKIKNILPQEITDLDAHYKPIVRNIPAVEAQFNADLVNLKASETAINTMRGEVELIKDNIQVNELNKQKANQDNLQYAKLYEEGLKQANPNRLFLQQQPNESSDDYIKRIQTIEDEKFDITIHGDKAVLSNIRKFKTNLKQLIREPSLIENVLKSFTPDEIFKINRYFEIIKTKFLKIFGYNNKSLTDNDIYDEISNILTAIEAPTVETFEIDETMPTAPGPAAPPISGGPAISGGPVEYSYLSGSKSLYITDVEDNSFMITNGKKTLYIKIGKKDGTKLILFSKTTNESGNFKDLKFKGSDPDTWDYLFTNYLQLLTPKNKEIYDQIFSHNKRDEIFDELETRHGLTPIDKIKKKKIFTSGLYNVNTYGWGLNRDQPIPKHIKFGNNILLLNKLYHKNILSLKTPSLHAIEYFPNINVSDAFVEIIMKISNNEQPTNVLLNSLKNEEKELLDTILFISGLHKKLNVNKNTHVEKLKNQLKLIEGEIQAGNNNKLLIDELKTVLNKLYLLGVVSLVAVRKHLKQFDN